MSIAEWISRNLHARPSVMQVLGDAEDLPVDRIPAALVNGIR